MVTFGKKNFTSAATLLGSYFAIRGIVFAVFQFGEVIARKSLGASDLMITILSMLMPITGFTSIWWGRLLEGRDQRPYILVGGLIGFGFVVTGLKLTSIYHLFVLHLLYFSTFSLLIPAQNRIIQAHIKQDKQGSFFGWAQSARMAFAAVMSLFAGYWLDKNTFGFQQLYFVAGLTGLFAIIVISSIPPGYIPANSRVVSSRRDLIMGTIRESIKLLKRRKDFFRFEMAFMFYGVAFMICLPVVPIFLVDDLNLSYSAIGIAKGTIMQAVMIIMIPLFGKLFDKTTPYRISGIVFLILVLFPVMLVMAKFVTSPLRDLFLYSAYFFHGLSFGGVSIVWGISSMRFAGKDEDAGVYQSIHMSFVGLRGLFAPLLGYIGMNLAGRTTMLLVTGVLFGLAGVAMLWLDRSDGALMRINGLGK